ncbi:MAG: saccharopine dehydrogenase NADP-binding domain-containing protein [Proteobacteria bacterium]|nr:saccharopine dehydrogenase NADP-binding domain-containing protein [Pseudomonadota bacterium]
MKILALGGCGEMGRYAVKTLLPLPEITGITIADIDGDRARAFAEECGPKTSHARVDAMDPADLKKAMAGADIVMNTTGPYFRFGVRVLDAAIETGCHYLDLNDDWEPTLEMLALSDKAREAGITAILGLGASPGVSNLLAATAVGELDETLEIYTGWDLDAARPERIGPKVSAAMIHGIHQLTGTIRGFENGTYTETRPLTRVVLDFPGMGASTAWTVGHPESVTLPRTFPGLTRSVNVMTTQWYNVGMLKFLGLFVNAGLLSVEALARLAEKLEGPSDPEKNTERMLAEMVMEGGHGLPPLFSLARGKKDGQPASVGVLVTSAPAGGMGGATGVPLAVGASLMARGRITRRGVFAPEAVLDPKEFFDNLAPLCSPPRKNANQLVLTTRSWEPARVADRLAELLS